MDAEVAADAPPVGSRLAGWRGTARGRPDSCEGMVAALCVALGAPAAAPPAPRTPLRRGAPPYVPAEAGAPAKLERAQRRRGDLDEAAAEAACWATEAKGDGGTQLRLWTDPPALAARGAAAAPAASEGAGKAEKAEPTIGNVDAYGELPMDDFAIVNSALGLIRRVIGRAIGHYRAFRGSGQGTG